MNEKLIIKGAREHNLKNIDLTLPRNKLIVFTGLSGSGKSSLAFDTIYAEGQRRYVESLSSYARLFLGQMEKPDVDYIEGLSPAISIDQKSTSNNPRSTVGTVTEIHDYMRLLYARVGIPHCPKCGRVIERQSIDQVVDRVMALDGRIQIIAPAVRAKKGEHAKLLEQIRKDGYVRVRVDGEVYDINEVPPLDKQKKHTIDVIVDRLIIKPGIEGRLAESMETAFAFGDGLAKVDVIGKEELIFSEKYSCPDCGISIEELTPRMFSFNNPYGACPCCGGLGMLMKIDPDIIVPDKSLSLNQNAINVSGWQSGKNGGSMSNMYFSALAEHYGFSMDTPFIELPKKVQEILLGYLLEIDRICRKYDIRYFLAGGTLLGAIRHHGFIPWDDDADVMMLREDYDRFMQVVQKELPENIFVQVPETEKGNHNPFTKLRINDTMFATEFTGHFMDMHNGIFFDVLAHDQTGNHRWSQKLHLMLTMLSRSIVFNKWGNTDIKSGGNHPVICRIVDHVKYLIPMPFAEWAQKKALTFFQNRNTDYLYDGMGRNLKRGAFPKSWLMETVYVDFEGYKFPVPKEYDQYLTWLYGDYMQMIPVSARRTSHSIVLTDLGAYGDFKI